jgi:hypothetical protein
VLVFIADGIGSKAQDDYDEIINGKTERVFGRESPEEHLR